MKKNVLHDFIFRYVFRQKIKIVLCPLGVENFQSKNDCLPSIVSPHYAAFSWYYSTKGIFCEQNKRYTSCVEHLPHPYCTEVLINIIVVVFCFLSRLVVQGTGQWRLWDLSSPGREIATLRGHPHPVYDISSTECLEHNLIVTCGSMGWH